MNQRIAFGNRLCEMAEHNGGVSPGQPGGSDGWLAGLHDIGGQTRQLLVAIEALLARAGSAMAGR